MRLPAAVRVCVAAFADVESASEAVSAIIGAGIVPTALEIMDAVVVAAVEAHYHAGFPLDAGAVLLVEIAGARDDMDARRSRDRAHRPRARRAVVASPRATRASAKRCGRRARAPPARSGGSRRTTTFKTRACRARNCPQALHAVGEIARAHDLHVGNVFHAGDGNLHPLLLFDRRDARAERGRRRSRDRDPATCIEMGGTISGEHGIGYEKRESLARVLHRRSRDDGPRARRRSIRTAVQSRQDLPERRGLRRSSRGARGTSDGRDARSVGVTAAGAREAGALSVAQFALGGAAPQRAWRPKNVEALARLLAAATNAAKPSSCSAVRRCRRSATHRRRAATSPCSTNGAERRRDYDPRDMTTGVDAGTTLAELARTLRRATAVHSDRRAAAARGTVGGTLAAGWAGPRAPHVRAPARSRHRLDRRAGRRHARESGRHGRQERHRLRYEQTLRRLARHARGARRVNFKTLPRPPVQRGAVARLPERTRERALAQLRALAIEPSARRRRQRLRRRDRRRRRD